eukprot:1183134-Rhodomonas_salina.1
MRCICLRACYALPDTVIRGTCLRLGTECGMRRCGVLCTEVGRVVRNRGTAHASPLAAPRPLSGDLARGREGGRGGEEERGRGERGRE